MGFGAQRPPQSTATLVWLHQDSRFIHQSPIAMQACRASPAWRSSFKAKFRQERTEEGGSLGKRGCPREAPTSLWIQGPPGARLSCLFAWLSPSGAEQSLPFDPWVVMRVHSWPRTLVSGHVVTWLRSPSRPRARLQGCRPQPGHTVSAPLLLLEGLLPLNPWALRTPPPDPPSANLAC